MYYGAVNPKSIYGLEAWYDASDISTMTISSGLVSQWNDKSGNGLNVTQGTAGYQPTFVENSPGKSYLHFGSNDFYTASYAGATKYSASTRTLTAIKVGTLSTETTQAFNIEDSSGTANVITPFVEIPTLNYCRISLVNTSTFVQQNGGISLTGGTNYILTSIISDSKCWSYVNDTLDLNGAALSLGTIASLNQLSIGRRKYVPATYNFTGDIKELLLYSRALSSAELTAIFKYINAKWGIY